MLLRRGLAVFMTVEFNAEIYNSLLTGQLSGILIGDNGYSLTPFLLTPFLNAASQEEEHYNRIHKKARCCIERAFGQPKRRFHCLSCGIRCSIDLLVP